MQLTLDLVDGAREQVSMDSRGIVSTNATRIARVKGLSDSSIGAKSEQARTALIRARRFVQESLPRGTLYSPTDPDCYGCMVTDYEAVGLSGEIAEIRVIYTTPRFPPGTGQPLIISDSSDEVSDATQFDPFSGKQLIIVWADENDPQNKQKYYPTMTYPSTLRTIVMTGLIHASDADLYRSAQRSVNDESGWMGIKKPGYWYYSIFRTQYTPSQKIYSATMEVKTWTYKDWSKYEVLKDPATGKCITVGNLDLHQLQQKPYKWGPYDSANGIIRVYPFPTLPFGELFGVGGINSPPQG